jgi:hypothetical protein
MRIAYVAMVWTDMVAPKLTPAGVGDMGLLSTPPDVRAEIVGIALLSAGDVEKTRPIWEASTDPGSMSIEETRRGLAATLLHLDRQGVSVEPQAKAFASRFLGPAAGAPTA